MKKKERKRLLPVRWDSLVLSAAGAATVCKANIVFMLCLPMLNLCSMANLFKAIPFVSLAVNYVHIGCYKDNASRAMPKLLGNWRHDNKAVEKCAESTAKAGYLVFGVQFAGECWSGPQAHMTYKKYGTSKRCVNGWGGNWAQDVYEIISK